MFLCFAMISFHLVQVHSALSIDWTCNEFVTKSSIKSFIKSRSIICGGHGSFDIINMHIKEDDEFHFWLLLLLKYCRFSFFITSSNDFYFHARPINELFIVWNVFDSFGYLNLKCSSLFNMFTSFHRDW